MSDKFKFYFRLFFTILGWAAITAIIYLGIPTISEADVSFLRIFRPWLSFVSQTNTMVLLYWTFSLLYINKDKRPFFLSPVVKGGITVYITFTFIIFGLFTAGLRDLQGLRAFASTIFHYVIPIAFIIDFILNTKRKSLRFTHIGYWAIYPFCYLIFSVINGLVNNIYFNPFFIRMEKLGWAITVNVFSQVLLMVFLGIVYVLLNRRLPNRA